MAQGVNNTYIGNFDGPSAQPTWPLGAGVLNGTYGAGVGVGNGSAAVGVGSVSGGQVHALGASTGLPSTPQTSHVPQECIMYPGVDVSANC
jgi:hypothetical protein